MATILVTGAARGIGHELVKRALTRGDTVFAAVRKAADSSKFPASSNLHVVQMDIANTQSVLSAFEEVDRVLAGNKLDGIINCAAVSIPGAIEVMPEAQFEQLYERPDRQYH